MVFEAHCISFPCTELLLFNYAKVNTVFHSMAPLMSCTFDGVKHGVTWMGICMEMICR